MHYEWTVRGRPSAMNFPCAALLATACLLLPAEGSPTPRSSIPSSTRLHGSVMSAADGRRPREARNSANSTRLSVVSLEAAWSQRWPPDRSNASRTTTSLAAVPWARAQRLYRTAEPSTTTPSGREGRAVWSIPSANSAAGVDVESDYDSYKKAYNSKPFDYNSSWWSSMQTGMPAVGTSVNSINSMLSSPLMPVRRGSNHQHHHPYRKYQPFVSAHWDDQDYGDYAAGGSQMVSLAHPHQHSHSQPVYYVNDHQSKDSWGDLTTKLIIAAIIKLLIVKVMGLTAFKLLAIGMIKVPIALAALGLKFAFIVKFFKFIKVLVAVIIIPIIIVAIIPLLIPILIPLFLVLLPVVLLPLLLLFPVPVLTPGTGAAGGGTVITITPGRRRREEEEQALNQLENRVMDSRRCLQKLACDVGYRSQVVKPYADWVMWLLSYMKPILNENRRIQLKGFMNAYKSGLAGRSCYRKYPCYSNNVNTSKATETETAGESDAADSEAEDEVGSVENSSNDDVTSIETAEEEEEESDVYREMSSSTTTVTNTAAANRGSNGTERR